MPLPGDHPLYPTYEAVVVGYDRAYAKIVTANGRFANAADAIGINDWITARSQLILAANALSEAVYYLTGYSYVGVEFPVQSWLLNEYDYWGGDVDMRAINDAMLKAEYLEISEYLSIHWAFQQIMWDQPFFPDQYAAIINRIRT